MFVTCDRSPIKEATAPDTETSRVCALGLPMGSDAPASLKRTRNLCYVAAGADSVHQTEAVAEPPQSLQTLDSVPVSGSLEL